MRGERRFDLAARKKTKIPVANSPIVEGSGAGVGENDGEGAETMLDKSGESIRGGISPPEIVVLDNAVWSGVRCSSARATGKSANPQKNSAAIIANFNFFLML
jgi:hypothetical protein